PGDLRAGSRSAAFLRARTGPADRPPRVGRRRGRPPRRGTTPLAGVAARAGHHLEGSGVWRGRPPRTGRAGRTWWPLAPYHPAWARGATDVAAVRPAAGEP